MQLVNLFNDHLCYECSMVSARLIVLVLFLYKSVLAPVSRAYLIPRFSAAAECDWTQFMILWSLRQRQKKEKKRKKNEHDLWQIHFLPFYFIHGWKVIIDNIEEQKKANIDYERGLVLFAWSSPYRFLAYHFSPPFSLVTVTQMMLYRHH